jgi:hypothetical protein
VFPDWRYTCAATRKIERNHTSSAWVAMSGRTAKIKSIRGFSAEIEGF